MDKEFEDIMEALLHVESQFRRNGFDKKMGTDSHLFLALANTLIIAVDDLGNLKSKHRVLIKKEVKKRLAEIEKDKPKIKVVAKATKRVKKVRVKPPSDI